MSEFINNIYLQKTADIALTMAKKLGADQATVHLNRNNGKSINVRSSKVETIESIRDQGFSITVYFDHKKGTAYSTDFSNISLQKTVQHACDIAKYTEADPCFGLANIEYLLAKHYDLDQNHPWTVDTSKLIDIAKECEQSALDYSSKITNSEGSTIDTNQSIKVMANSHGFNDFILGTKYSVSCSVIAEENNKMQTDYDYCIARKHTELSNIHLIGKNAAKKAVAKLNAKNINTGTYPVVLDAGISSSIFGNFIQAISGGALYHKTSFLLDSLGTQIFPEFINIKECPLLQGGLFSSAFDNDGVATMNKTIIENGILQSYILSNYTACKLAMQNTANAGGVFNLYLNANYNSRQELLKIMDKGILVMDFMGSSTNLITGDYSRGISGFWVENGTIQHPVEEVTIAGNLKTMYKNIIGIANDVDKKYNIISGSVLIDQMMISSN